METNQVMTQQVNFWELSKSVTIVMTIPETHADAIREVMGKREREKLETILIVATL